MPRNETELVKETIAALQSMGIWCWRANSGSVTRRMSGNPPGTPDILGVLQPMGRLFGLEAKWGEGKLRPTQKGWHNLAHEHGVPVAVFRSTKEAIELIDYWGGWASDQQQKLELTGMWVSDWRQPE